MASEDLVLKSNCSCCGWRSSSPSMEDLYGSNCKHLTLCLPCGKKMAENRAKCPQCGTAVTLLIKEYKVRVASNEENSCFVGRFSSGLPNFADQNNKWCSRREVSGGTTSTSLSSSSLGRKGVGNQKNINNKQPWLLEDKTGTQYQGKFDGGQCSNYCILMMQGTEIVAIPVDSWYNFNKIVKYRALTLDEAEEKMRNRRRTEDGYSRWMMKSASKGEEEEEEIENNNSNDKGEKNRKHRPPLNKKGGNYEDDDVVDDVEEVGLRISDLKMNDNDDEDIEKGDDWEHEEIFADDDEDMDGEDQLEDCSAPEIPVPPEISQDEDEDGNDDDLGLCESGKQLKKLLAKANYDLNLSEPDEDVKSHIPPLNYANGKRKLSTVKGLESSETNNAAPMKKFKSETKVSSLSESVEDVKSQIPPLNSANGKRKLIYVYGSESNETHNGAPLKKFKSETKVITPPVTASSPLTKEEITSFLLSRRKSVTAAEFYAEYKSRLKSKEDKQNVTSILKSITRIKKNVNGSNLIVLVDS